MEVSMWKGLLAIASALVLAATLGAGSADAKPKGYGFKGKGHHYGWVKKGRYAPPGWSRGKAWWKTGRRHPGKRR
jgi:hypothetical protein